MNNSNSTDLSQGSVGKLLFSLALPSILAQIINVLYNMVDRMYIGHIPEVGPSALTGVGITMPVIMAVSAFAALVCMGGAPRAAIFLGKNQKDEAENVLGNCLMLLIIVAIVLTILLEVFGQQLLWVFGASENTITYAWSYLQIYAIGTIFVQMALGLNAFINTQGYAKWGMATVGIGAILNIVLDPIFIFVMGMGVRGAALATIISQCVSALFCLWFLSSKHSFLQIKTKYLKLSGAVILPCVALGLSPFTMQITEALISVCFNSSLLKYGGDIAVGAMTILTSVMQFSMLPLQGMTQGSQPIISYNFGAHKYDRIRKCFKILLIACCIYSTTLWALCEVTPQLFASMFTSSPELMAYASTAMRIYTLAQCIFGIQIACQQTFIALGNAKVSLFLACLRKIILLIPLIYIMPAITFDPAMKVWAVFAAEPVADVLAVTTTAIMFFRYYKKVLKQPESEEARAA